MTARLAPRCALYRCNPGSDDRCTWCRHRVPVSVDDEFQEAQSRREDFWFRQHAGNEDLHHLGTDPLVHTVSWQDVEDAS